MTRASGPALAMLWAIMGYGDANLSIFAFFDVFVLYAAATLD